MKNKKLYNLIGKMALEFRLSLDNICKIMNKPVTDETKTEIYENIKNYMDDYYQLQDMFEYLFFYETVNESSKASLIAYNKARNYLLRYNEAIKEDNKEKVIEIRKELTKTDRDFKELRNRGHEEKYTIDDIAIISKYRLKYAIPRETFCLNFPKVIFLRNLEAREEKLESEILKNKIKLLADYYLNFINNKQRRR